MIPRSFFKMWVPLVGILFCFAESRAENGATFASGSVASAGVEMPYRVARIGNSNPSAVVIYLHGGTSKGSDNAAQLQEPGIDSIANYLVSQQMDALFLVPQCPSDKSWGGPMLGVLKAMIGKFVAEEQLASTDVYLFGGSMGGTGTWSMLSAYPGLFTAAMPVAGNPSKCNAEAVAQTPVYTVMGTADRIMSVETAANFVGQLNALNGIARFDIEEGWTHEMTCIQSYTAARLGWVFSHQRRPTRIAASPSDQAFTAERQYFSLTGQRLAQPPTSGPFITRQRNAYGTFVTSKSICR